MRFGDIHQQQRRNNDCSRQLSWNFLINLFAYETEFPGQPIKMCIFWTGGEKKFTKKYSIFDQNSKTPLTQILLVDVFWHYDTLSSCERGKSTTNWNSIQQILLLNSKNLQFDAASCLNASTTNVAVDSSIIFKLFFNFQHLLVESFLNNKKKLQFYHHPKMCKSLKMWEKLIYGKFETRRASKNKELWTRSQPRACNVCKATRNADFKSTRSWMLAWFSSSFS